MWRFSTLGVSKTLLVLFGLSATGCGSSTEVSQPANPPLVENPSPIDTPPPPDAGPNPEPQPPTLEAPTSDYLGFESSPVRPVVQSGNYLYVSNTSNHSVEVFELNTVGEPQYLTSIAVGMEPVALALANEQELWVVNHLSDSVSIVDLSSSTPVVTRTLLVGDEPQDIVFANGKAFISAAHRGQHLTHHSLQGVSGAGDPQLHTPGVGRADVWVFDTENLGNALGGVPQKIVSLFGDSPRGLAVSPDEKHVYVGVFHSGNKTTAVHEAVICPGFEDDDFGAYPCQVMDGISSPQGLDEGWLPGGRTAPGVNAYGQYQPWTSMIVQYDEQTGQWQDSKGRNFSNGVRFTLPDLDVFAIDSQTLQETSAFAGVGTTLFNLVTHPQTGDLFVSNTDANNAQRFEGPGEFVDSTVQGNIAKSQVTYINPRTGVVRPRHLNNHIDYSSVKAPQNVKPHSVSTPTQMVLDEAGDYLYLVAMGSDKVAVLPTGQLQDDQYWNGAVNELDAAVIDARDFDPREASQQYISVAGGPAGLALNDSQKRLYVFTRYDNALVTLNSETGEELSRITMNTPEPEAYQAGRFMLYDANRSSSNGESSCASCHIFGDTDHLSWNLGNPDEANTRNPQPFPTANISTLGCDLVGPEDPSCQLLEVINGDGDELTIASMKGPMATQTMRGMSTHGHMHWRGDRANGYFGDDIAQILDERVSFMNFIVAFEGLLGMDIELPASVEAQNKTSQVVQLEQDMQQFADFMLAVTLPPNPVRPLDNSLSAPASIGADFFHGVRRSDGLPEDIDINGPTPDGVNCEGCHGVDAEAGFYGTRGEIAHGGEIQILKVPQLRNLYTRVGMFGLPDREGFLPSHTKQHQGEQIRGFGFLHDGATDQLVNFLRGGVFDNGEAGCPPDISSAHGCEFNEGFVGIPDEQTREGLVDYLMEFDNDLAPIVGQQITLNQVTTNQQTNDAVTERIQLLRERAQTPFVSKILGGEVTECDLIARGRVAGESRGYLYLPEEDKFVSDDQSSTRLSFDSLTNTALAAGNSLTFTCAVPGQGWQMALDRDLDGIFNADDL